MADAKLSSVRSSFFLMKSSCEADTHCLFQIMNGNICFVVLIYCLKKSLFFSLVLQIPSINSIPSSSNSGAKNIRHSAFFLCACILISGSYEPALPLFSVKFCFFWCIFLLYFSFIFFFYTESYKSIRTIWAVSTILVPESILHF